MQGAGSHSLEPVAMSREDNGLVCLHDRVNNTKRMNPFRQLFSELRRRGVFKAAGIYLAAGWLLIQVLDVVLTPIGLPPWALSLAIWLVILGFPFTLAFSWRYDVGSDGIRRTPPATDYTPEDLHISKADFSLLALGALGVAALAIYLANQVSEEQSLALSPATAAAALPTNSIAVLPFRNLGGDDANYLGQGLAEDILHRLASIEGLPVTSRTSSFELDTTNMSMPDIGLRLRARNVLEGSVRREGDRVRIVAQLIDTTTDQHLWSTSYNRDIKDLFQIYDEISLAIAGELQLTLAPTTQVLGPPPTSDIQAYDYFLQARSILQRATDTAAVNNALAFFNNAVERDPGFADAWAGLCRAWLASHDFEPSTDKVEQAQGSCRKALTLDPDLTEGRVAMGELLRNTGQPGRAIEQYQQALRENQKLAIAWRGMGQAQDELGRATAAETSLLRAVELDPDDLLNRYALGDFYFYQGRYGEAEDAYDRLTQHPKAGVTAFNTLGASRSMLGDFEGAATAFRQVIALEPTDIAYANVGVIYYLMGQLSDAVVMLEEAINLAPEDPYHWSNLADVFRQIPGRQSDALNAYRRAAEIGSALLEVNPGDTEMQTNQAHCLARLGDDAAALSMIDAVLAEAPGDPYAYYYAALIHLEAGRNDAALEAIEQALALNYPVQHLRADPQFEALREDSTYSELLAGDTTKENQP